MTDTDEKPLRKTLVRLDDLGYHVLVGTDGERYSSMNFEVLVVAGEDAAGVTQYLAWNEFGGSYATPDITNASVEIKGFVKWDGCGHFNFGPGYHHVCGSEAAANLGKLLNEVFLLARAHIRGYSE